MWVYMLLSFLAGGMVGILGMALCAYGSKLRLMRENQIYKERLQFLEKESSKKHYQPVEDPRARVHALVN